MAQPQSPPRCLTRSCSHALSLGRSSVLSAVEFDPKQVVSKICSHRSGELLAMTRRDRRVDHQSGEVTDAGSAQAAN